MASATRPSDSTTFDPSTANRLRGSNNASVRSLRWSNESTGGNYKPTRASKAHEARRAASRRVARQKTNRRNSVVTELQTTTCWDQWSPTKFLRRWRERATLIFATLDGVSPLGAYLTEKELLLLAKACSIMHFKEGEFLPDSPFYIVVAGAVTVMDVASGDVLCTRGQWAFFTSNAGRGVVETESSPQHNGEKRPSPPAVRHADSRSHANDDRPMKFHLGRAAAWGGSM